METVRESQAARKSAAVETELKAGDRVKHEHFGKGQVMAVSGQGLAMRARILFHEFGEKNLVVHYARLTKVSS